MTGRFYVGVSLAGLLALGAAVYARPPEAHRLQTASQEKRATKSVSGKVTAIGTGGHSFSLQVADESKTKMDFVVDKSTQVNGQVREGSSVTVEYTAMESGQNLAVTITAQA